MCAYATLHIGRYEYISITLHFITLHLGECPLSLPACKLYYLSDLRHAKPEELIK